MSLIIPNLYLGDKQSSEGALNRYDLIVNCTKDIPDSTADPNIRQSNGTVLRVPIDDTPEESATLSMYLPWITEQIHQVWSQGGTVLVHCFAGVSRSATVVAAYLMRYQGFYDLGMTVLYIKSKRPQAFSVVNFKDVLVDFQNNYK
jgi:protein-tyrosine phosphatase